HLDHPEYSGVVALVVALSRLHRAPVARDLDLARAFLDHGTGDGAGRAAGPGDEPLLADVHRGDAIRLAARHQAGGSARDAARAADRGGIVRGGRAAPDV